jgi:hypothetical protein
MTQCAESRRKNAACVLCIVLALATAIVLEAEDAPAATPAAAQTSQSRRHRTLLGRISQGLQLSAAATLATGVIAGAALLYQADQLEKPHRAQVANLPANDELRALQFAPAAEALRKGHTFHTSEPIPLERIPPKAQLAVVLGTGKRGDSGYCEHAGSGFRWDGKLRWEGGSLRWEGSGLRWDETVETALAELILDSHPHEASAWPPSRWLAKVKLARRIHRELGKRRTLEVYLNARRFADEWTGIVAVAAIAFRKTPDALSARELALIGLGQLGEAGLSEHQRERMKQLQQQLTPERAASVLHCVAPLRQPTETQPQEKPQNDAPSGPERSPEQRQRPYRLADGELLAQRTPRRPVRRAIGSPRRRP